LTREALEAQLLQLSSSNVRQRRYPGSCHASERNASFQIAVLLFRAKTNRLKGLRPLVPAILEALSDIKAGPVRTVGA
jgi:hypothetical protein